MTPGAEVLEEDEERIERQPQPQGFLDEIVDTVV
jgi:hypothetical protein